MAMHLIQTRSHRGSFEPLVATRAAQAAVMDLQPGQSSDDDVSNEHPRCEQWLFVVAGTGRAVIAQRRGRRRSVRLQAGTLLVIERGDLHQIINTSRKVLRTINFYMPPAYRSDGSLRQQANKASVGR
jgi:mannose-6-phosphate isomerase-like protein (cupin superfamily)